MSKRTRQQAIVELVASKRIPSQAVLADELRGMGIAVTQATLSRDIAELNLVKSKEGYSRPQDASVVGAAQLPDPSGTLRRVVTKMDKAGNLVVLKTSMGSASPAAIAIDEGNHEEVLGTIAGDDTILVITRDEEQATSFVEKLEDLLH
jgi:transcriptional regulator of arginine metabolism